MNLLLDTHVLLWWLDDPSTLSDRAESAIRDPDNNVLVSAATVWEIIIKKAIGKLDAPDDLDQALRDCGFAALPVTVPHALAVRSLPTHHRDPFDRMLVCAGDGRKPDDGQPRCDCLALPDSKHRGMSMREAHSVDAVLRTKHLGLHLPWASLAATFSAFSASLSFLRASMDRRHVASAFAELPTFW